MSASNDLWRMLGAIRDADMSSTDRELLKPALAAQDAGKTIAVPSYVEKRIRDIHAHMPRR